MSSTVRIPWSRNYDNEYKWNEVCVWAIKMFGLPGDRFQTHANVHYMDFVFKSNKDALMMAIQWEGQIVPDDTLTVEHIGNMLNG
jgi:hypothetical protein